MSKNIVVSLLCVLVVVVVAVSTLPVFGAINSGAETIENEGAGALRFDLVDSHSGFNISYDFGDDHLTITNGSDVQTISYDSDDMTTIYYADDNVGIWLDGTDLMILGITSDNSTLCASITDDFTVQRTLSGVTITYGMESASFNAPTWAFIPNSAGKYGYFDAGTEVSLPEGARVAYVSDNFAGVYAYNGINNFNLPITLEPEILDNVLSGAKWIKVIEELEEDPQIIPFDPGITPINPNIPIVIDDPDDPIVIDDPPNVIMAVPTPTYTEGDWGYDVVTLNGVDVARIVAYLGTGGNIVVPSTLGGYEVKQFGKGLIGDNTNVFDNSTLSPNSTLTFNNNLETIRYDALRGTSNLTGNLVIPDSVTSIKESAFYRCTGFTGIKLSNNLTTIERNAFDGCSGLTGNLVIPDSVTSIGIYAFNQCLGLSGIKLSNNLTTIPQYFCYQCTSLSGDLVIPDSVTVIDNHAFYKCSNLNSLTLSDNLTSINSSAFWGCTSLMTPLVIPDSVTSIGNSAFNRCSNIPSLIISSDITFGTSVFTTTSNLKEVLNFSSLELTTTSYGLHADEVRDYVNCIGYLAPVEYTTGSANDGPAYDLIGLIPLVFAFGAVLFTIGYMLLRKF